MEREWLNLIWGNWRMAYDRNWRGRCNPCVVDIPASWYWVNIPGCPGPFANIELDGGSR